MMGIIIIDNYFQVKYIGGIMLYKYIYMYMEMNNLWIFCIVLDFGYIEI